MVTIRQIQDIDYEDLARFFEKNNVPEITKYFHPFPLNSQTAHEITCASHLDRYYIAILDDQIAGFCMLRGWDEGYQIPSLGLFVAKNQQGLGLGKQMVKFCLQEANKLDCHSIRLSVYETNITAVSLYRSFGFTEKNRVPIKRKGVFDTTEFIPPLTPPRCEDSNSLVGWRGGMVCYS